MDDILSAVVALDVDGVLVTSRKCHSEPAEFYSVALTADEIPHHPFNPAHVVGGVTLPIYFNGRNRPFVRQLVEAGSDVVIASSWERAFGSHLAPLLDQGHEPLFTKLPIVPVSQFEPDPHWPHEAAMWKARALAALYPGRRLCFVDDQAWRLTRLPWNNWREGITKVVVPQESVGLTRRERESVLSFAQAR